MNTNYKHLLLFILILSSSLLYFAPKIGNILGDIITKKTIFIIQNKIGNDVPYIEWL